MMNIRDLRKLGSVILLSGLFFLAACNKTEFLPDPEGSQVPFQSDATKTVDELLAASTAKLYYTAWQKSNIKDFLKEKGSKVVYTVFAPSDAAMESVGLSAGKINQMPVEELDSLMMFYTTIGLVTKDELKLRNDNFMVKSLLERPGLYVKYYENTGEGVNVYDHYYYRHYVGIKGDDLLMNGKSVGKLNYMPGINGGVYILEKTVERPVKTMFEVLKADGRFTMFIESQRMADEIYLEKIASDLELVFGYRPEMDEIKMYYAYNRSYYQKDWGINPPIYPGFVGPNITVSTLFAPTDEAFHKAGFQSVADILKFNERSAGSVRFDDNTYTAVGGYPMDTVYNFHRDWGRLLAPKDPSYGIAASNTTVFYSNVLNPVLNNYLVNAGGNAQIQYAYKMPLEFSLNNNSVQLKVKGSEYPAASVIDENINTLNGPIHVVDRLLFPKGFKLN